MQKIERIITILCFTLILCGCNLSSQKTVTCKTEEDGLKMSYKMTAKKDLINNLEIKITMTPESMGIESVKSLNSQDKKNLEEQLLKNFDLTNENEKGVKVSIEYNENIDIIIAIDIEKADQKVLEKFDLDELEDEERSLEETVKEMEKEGLTCQKEK